MIAGLPSYAVGCPPHVCRYAEVALRHRSSCDADCAREGVGTASALPEATRGFCPGTSRCRVWAALHLLSVSALAYYTTSQAQSDRYLCSQRHLEEEHNLSSKILLSENGHVAC